MLYSNKLIIFDMDNTLIHSHLDFSLMKSAALNLLRETEYEPDEALPLTQTMNHFRLSAYFSPQVETNVWRRVDEIEYAGLENSVVEPGVEQVLELLSPYTHLTALTNTKEDAAYSILNQLGLAPKFEHILGRNGKRELKPSSGGILEILACYPDILAEDALSVGDALIDIHAAHSAGLRFCAYNRSRAEQWLSSGYKPHLYLTKWDEKAALAILALLNNEVYYNG